MKDTRIRLFPRIRPRRGTLLTEGGKGQRYCPNCHYPLPHYGEFCSNCGQRYSDGRVPLKYLVQDLLDSVLNIDSKFFRTCLALAIPGKLTLEFFQGRHKRYASPARLFFVATVIHFAVIGFIVNEDLSTSLAKLMEGNRRRSYEMPLRNSLQKAREEVESLFPGQPSAHKALDSLFVRIQNSEQDSQYLEYFSLDSNWNFQSKKVWIAAEDYFNKSAAQIAAENRINGKLENLIFQQTFKINTHVDNFGQFVMGQMVWMVVLMMPALALMLKLLYVRRRRFFVEHLVFSFHYHAFAFWVVSIMLLMMNWTNGWENEAASALAPTFVAFAILIYLFMAMRKVYKQGFFKTFIKYNLLNFSYLMIFCLFLGLTVVVSMFLF